MAIKVNGTTVIDDSRNLVNIASGAGGGYWNELSSVTLGGSVVSSIDVTLTSGYDAHRIDFRLPVPDGGSAKKNLLSMTSSGNTAQNFHFATASSVADEQTDDTVMEWFSYAGGFTPAYFFGSLTILDALSSSVNTRFMANLANTNGAYGRRVAGFSAGFQNTAAATGKVKFSYDGGSFGSGSNLYYKLYGQTYA